MVEQGAKSYFKREYANYGYCSWNTATDGTREYCRNTARDTLAAIAILRPSDPTGPAKRKGK